MSDVRTAGVRWDGPYMSSDRERTWIGRIESQAWRTGWAIVAQVREEAGASSPAWAAGPTRRCEPEDACYE